MNYIIKKIKVQYKKTCILSKVMLKYKNKIHAQVAFYIYNHKQICKGGIIVLRRERLTAIIIGIITLGYTCFVEWCTFSLTGFNFKQGLAMFAVYSYISIMMGSNIFYAWMYGNKKSENNYIKYLVQYCIFKSIGGMLLEIAIAIAIGLLHIKINNVEVSTKLFAVMIIYELIIIVCIIGAHLKANTNWEKYLDE